MLKYLSVSSGVKERLEEKQRYNESRRKLDSHREKAAKIAFIQQRVKDNAASVNDNCIEHVIELEVKAILSEILETVDANLKQSETQTLINEKMVHPFVAATRGVKRKCSHDFKPWIAKSHAIYMYLHPKIFNKKTATVCAKLGIAPGTFRGWVSTESEVCCVQLWYDTVAKLTWGDIKKFYSSQITEEFDSEVSDDEKVSLAGFHKHRSDTVVLTEMSGLSRSKRSKLGCATLQAKIRGENPTAGKFVNVNSQTKHVKTSIKSKYPEMQQEVIDHVVNSWHSGSPATRRGCTALITENAQPDSEFYKLYVDPNKHNASKLLSTWLSRVLASIGYTMRKNTVSQSIPNDWRKQAVDFSSSALKKFKDNNVDVIVNADQTFVKFLCAQDKLIAPVSTKCVGSTVEVDDERKGITCMITVSMEKQRNCGYIKSRMHPPFMVFDGVTGAILDTKYADWDERPGHCASVNFQRKHWFDKHITLRWVKWLLKQFPPELRIGLIWDMAPGHKDSVVEIYLKQQEDAGRLYTQLIPGGLTSIVQICDLLVNGPYKQHLRREYGMFKEEKVIKLRAEGNLGKIKVKTSRDQLTIWSENFMRKFNSLEDEQQTITKGFTKTGVNPFSEDSSVCLESWLSSLEENALYKSMLHAAEALDISD